MIRPQSQHLFIYHPNKYFDIWGYEIKIQTEQPRALALKEWKSLTSITMCIVDITTSRSVLTYPFNEFRVHLQGLKTLLYGSREIHSLVDYQTNQSRTLLC